MLSNIKTADRSITYQSVFRICHKENYTAIGNNTLQNIHLSDFAFRLHLHMLRQKKNYRFYQSQLAANFKKSRRTIQRALTELSQAGLVRYNITGFNEGYYQVFETSWKETVPGDYTGVNPNLPELNLPEPNLPELNLPEPNLPELNLPELNLPEPDLPELNLPEPDTNTSAESQKAEEPQQPTVSANEENTRNPEEPLFTQEEFSEFFALALSQIARIHTMTDDDRLILQNIYSDYMGSLTVYPRLSKIISWLVNGLEDWKENKRLRSIRRKAREEKTAAIARRDLHQANMILKDIIDDKVNHDPMNRDWDC